MEEGGRSGGGMWRSESLEGVRVTASSEEGRQGPRAKEHAWSLEARTGQETVLP